MRITRCLLPVVGLALALGALAGCATERGLAQARQSDELRDYDTAVARYSKVVRERPANQEAQLGLERAKLRASEAHLLRGRRLFQIGKYDDAVLELQIASDLNPTNADADRDLQAARSAVRAKLAAPAEGKTALETLLSRTRDLPAAGYELPNVKLASQIVTGTQATSRQVYLTIARMANLSVTFDSAFRDTAAPVSLLNEMTVKQALDAVARSTGTFYQVTAPSTIVVVPDTPQKRREYTEEAERVFYIQNTDLKETMDALRVVSDIRSISPLTGINALVVRDTPERLQVAGRFLSAFDKARPEVVVDVEILEVDRTKLMEYGLQLASPPTSAGAAASPGIDGAAVVDQTNLTAKSLRSLTQANILLSGLPALYYRLLKTDTHTRTLANPHLRMSDGIGGTAEFGERIPTPNATIGAIATGGVSTVPITQYTYQNIGVNITINPRVHANDEVTLALNIELSNVQGTGFGGLPTFGNRKVTTSIRLKDGETNILGGLIRDDERFVKDGIPGLSDVPGLDHLFTKNHREATETDVVVMLTPHIVRVLDLAEEDLRPLKLSREGAGVALIESQPLAPPPPIIREPGGAGSSNPVENPAAPIVKPVPAPPVIIRRAP
jgi:general secretion pathway protein D